MDKNETSVDGESTKTELNTGVGEGQATNEPMVQDTPDAPEIPETPDAPEVPETPEMPESMKVPEAPSTPEAEPKRVVEVDADLLKKLVDGYDKQQQQIEDLTGAADLGRLEKIQRARASGELVKKAKLSVYNNKIVIGWVKHKDDVYVDNLGRINEDQSIILFLDGGTKTDPISYKEFSRITEKVEGEVISEKKAKDGSVFFTVKLDNGKEYEVLNVFLN